MVMSKIYVLFVMGICCSTKLKGQIGLRIPENAISQTSSSPPQYKTYFYKKNTYVIDNQYVNNTKQTKIAKQLPSVFAVDKMPFFCKIEYKMGLNKKLPLKFRLGDVQYVDELEGK
jgi:hypothetical protein